MNLFQAFAGRRRNAVRNSDRLRERRHRVLLSVNAETARLLREHGSLEADRQVLLGHLTSSTVQ